MRMRAACEEFAANASPGIWLGRCSVPKFCLSSDLERQCIRVARQFSFASAALVIFLFCLPVLRAQFTVQYEATDLADTTPGQDLWQYTYSVSGFSFQTNQGFSVFFDDQLYRNLQNPRPNSSPDWSVITVQTRWLPRNERGREHEPVGAGIDANRREDLLVPNARDTLGSRRVDDQTSNTEKEQKKPQRYYGLSNFSSAGAKNKRNSAQGDCRRRVWDHHCVEEILLATVLNGKNVA